MSMKARRLSTGDRDFYQKVRLAIFTNPFSDERVAVDRFITGSSAPVSGKKLVQRLNRAVAERLDKTFAAKQRSILPFSGEDGDLLRDGILFHIFHKYVEDFDDHIGSQIKSGDTPCSIPFSNHILGDMISFGIDRKHALRYFSLFFQMRRAFYFINKIIGRSPCMKNLRRNLWNNIFTHDIGLYEKHLYDRLEDFSTLLLGPTGTGKGLAAAAIGRSGFIPFDEKRGCFSSSFTQAFVALNLSQFPEQLLESELFGHKKGSFTGAMENHDGVLARCSPYGAIFLDEIGEVSKPVQIKLLQVLQDRWFSPVGSHQKKRFQGRVIAATNRSVAELRLTGIFRDDFYYRLCSDVIKVPSLSQRIQEDPAELDDLLAHMTLRIIGTPSPELVADIKTSLGQTIPPQYSWPGNVRELEQCVRSILIKKSYEGDLIVAEAAVGDGFIKGLEEGSYTASQLLSHYCGMLYKKFNTYEEVARRTGLDRRTVKKYIRQNPIL